MPGKTHAARRHAKEVPVEPVTSAPRHGAASSAAEDKPTRTAGDTLLALTSASLGALRARVEVAQGEQGRKRTREKKGQELSAALAQLEADYERVLKRR